MQATTTGSTGGRPMVMGTRGVVSSGHFLATEIGMDILRRGGNAADAAAAVGFALTLLKAHQNGIGGEVPTLVYAVDEKKVWAVSGNGVAPREATLDRYLQMGLKIIPGDGFLPALVPPAPATWIALLERFGTMRLIDVLGPAIELAERGFPMYASLHWTVAGLAKRFREEWPSSAAVWMPDDRAPAMGEIFRQPDWAATFTKLLDAEAAHKDRAAGLAAARDVFYRGEIAERIVDFCRSTPIRDASGQEHTSLLTLEDFADYAARVEEPVATDYRGVTVHKCGPWTQGPALCQSLNLLEGFDLKTMGHNSTDYIHTVLECMKLAYADREYYYGDPLLVDVPMDRLLSKDYAAARRELVDPNAASLELRPDGWPAISAASS